MRSLTAVFLVVALILNNNCVVLANNTVDGIRIDGIKDIWCDEPYEITLNIRISEGIKDVCVSLFKGGVFEDVYYCKFDGRQEVFSETLLLGDKNSKLYEGITEWIVIAKSLNDDTYDYSFVLKLDYTKPVINTDLFGDFGYEVLFDYRDSVEVSAHDDGSGVELFRINPSYSQNEFVNDKVSPYILEDEFKVIYTYPDGKEYGYVLYAKDKAGNISTRIIMTRYNITSRLKRIIPRGNYD